jgi:branched-chain amino acid transport system permease protein
MGYNVVYGGTRIFNLAQGQVLMVGVMLTWFFRESLGLPAIVAIVIASLGAGITNVLVERLAVAPLYLRKNVGEHTHLLGAFITTLGAAIVLQNLANLVWGHEALPFQQYFDLSGLHVGGVTITAQQTLMVTVAVLTVVAYELFTTRTRWGTALQAMSEDSEAAMLRGVPIVRGRMLAFGLAGIISGLGGAVIGPVAFANPNVGFEFGLKGFVAIAIGGFGSTTGALAGGLILGITEALMVTFGDDQYRAFASLLLMLVVLLVRPRGIAGRYSLRAV